MSMKNKFVFIISVIVVVCLMLSAVFILKTNPVNEESVKIRESAVSSMLIENVQLSPVVALSYNTLKIAINKNDSTPTLIYRFPQHMCESCLHEDLSELLNFQRQNSKAAIHILPAYSNDRNSQIMLKNLLHNFDFQILPADSLCVPISEQDGTEKRYFAIISSDKKIDMIFFPQRHHQEFTRRYFLEVKKMLKW